jgi:hypothetical protein
MPIKCWREADPALERANQRGFGAVSNRPGRRSQVLSVDPMAGHCCGRGICLQAGFAEPTPRVTT